MIFWTGYGFLVPLVAFGCLVGAELASELAFEDSDYYQENTWPMALGFGAAGAFLALTAYRFPDPQPRVMIDEETGERVLVEAGERHTFVFIPLRFWSALLVVFGILVTLFPIIEP